MFLLNPESSAIKAFFFRHRDWIKLCVDLITHCRFSLVYFNRESLVLRNLLIRQHILVNINTSEGTGLIGNFIYNVLVNYLSVNKMFFECKLILLKEDLILFFLEFYPRWSKSAICLSENERSQHQIVFKFQSSIHFALESAVLLNLVFECEHGVTILDLGRLRFRLTAPKITEHALHA